MGALINCTGRCMHAPAHLASGKGLQKRMITTKTTLAGLVTCGHMGVQLSDTSSDKTQHYSFDDVGVVLMISKTGFPKTGRL